MLVFVVQVKTELNNYCIEEEESLAAECVCSSKSLIRYRTLRQNMDVRSFEVKQSITLLKRRKV
jgi:hypothetical protein